MPDGEPTSAGAIPVPGGWGTLIVLRGRDPCRVVDEEAIDDVGCFTIELIGVFEVPSSSFEVSKKIQMQGQMIAIFDFTHDRDGL